MLIVIPVILTNALIASISNYIKVAREFIVDEESFRFQYGGVVSTGDFKVGTTECLINKIRIRPLKNDRKDGERLIVRIG